MLLSHSLISFKIIKSLIFCSLIFQTTILLFIPWQSSLNPFAEKYPEAHEHAYVPTEFEHVDWLPQILGVAVHSSISQNSLIVSSFEF